jgi:hypothetical protein
VTKDRLPLENILTLTTIIHTGSVSMALKLPKTLSVSAGFCAILAPIQDIGKQVRCQQSEANPMKQFFSLCILCLLLATAVPAYADIARPVPSPSPQALKTIFHTRLVIVPDSKAWEARLQISQSDLRELRAALSNTPGNESMSASIARSSARTMLAGLFMFLSVSFAGIWLARSFQSRGQKAMTALLLGTAFVGVTAIMTQANAGPPGSYYWRKLPQNLSKGAPTNGGLDIVVVPDGSDGSGMKLIIPTRPD